MSRVLTALEIATRALEKIGAYSINDAGANADDLSRALEWLDMLVGELAGTERCFWLVKATKVLDLEADVDEYDVHDEFGNQTFQFPIGVSLRDATGDDRPISILRRNEFEAIGSKAEAGIPEGVYIDRLGRPKLHVWPVPRLAGSSLMITYQAYADDMTAGGGKINADLPAAWNRWVVTALAADIGSGPVRRLPLQEVSEFRQDAERSRSRLMGFQNKEHVGRRFTQYRDF